MQKPDRCEKSMKRIKLRVEGHDFPNIEVLHRCDSKTIIKIEIKS